MKILSPLAMIELGCIMIAVKIENTVVRRPMDLILDSIENVTKGNLLEQEASILESLSWDFNAPLPDVFLAHYLSKSGTALECHAQCKHRPTECIKIIVPVLAGYLIELVMVDRHLFFFNPSVLAEAGLTEAVSIMSSYYHCSKEDSLKRTNAVYMLGKNNIILFEKCLRFMRKLLYKDLIVYKTIDPRNASIFLIDIAKHPIWNNIANHILSRGNPK
jgi:hypothetical protein